MIKKNYEIVEEKILKKCLETGRKREELVLIAVSKTMPSEIINKAFEFGLLHFGENKAQEFRDKTNGIDLPIIWHFIGHLQTNKVKYIIKSAEFIHSVDSVKLVEEIDRKALKENKVQKVLLEINTSDEESKFGLKEESEIISVLEFCKNCGNINPVGLMTMAPFVDDSEVIRKCFRKLRILKEDLNKHGFGLRELSMGMTNDFEIAIEEGATMLRIGSAIFGERNY